MRNAVLIAACLSGALLSPAAAAPGDAGQRQAAPQAAPQAPARPSTRRQTLDDLFARLAAAKDETEARGIAGLIERRFAHSGSDTADLLMGRAGEALQAKDAALAVELLDRVTMLRPDWAEAWSRRATAFYLLDDPASATADIRQALAHEPRHYEAWAALGHIEMAAGHEKRALEAYRKALSIHPFLSGIKEAVSHLAPDIDGRDL
jgi:Tfp pilus assembly protein PilF